MLSPIVSVVIPVFNVEQYLERCVDSIIKQSYQKYELILVDDGSTDNSGKICDEFAKQNERIKVIHTKNGGPSYARNLGIKVAVGEYLMFCDSDDEVEEHWIEKMINACHLNPNALVICGYNVVFEKTGTIQRVVNAPKGDYSKSQYFELYEQTGSACIKVFNKEIIDQNNISFNEDITYGEDIIFTLDYLDFAQSLYIIEDVLYHIHIYSGDRTTLSQNVSYYQMKCVFDRRIQYIDDMNYHNYIKLFFGNLWQRFNELSDRKEIEYKYRIKEAKDILNDTIFQEYISEHGEAMFDKHSLGLIKKGDAVGYYLRQKASRLKKNLITGRTNL